VPPPFFGSHIWFFQVLIEVLFISVVTPSSAQDLPVVVWIHGFVILLL
jgi:hypothetical protein